jgi:hypothetical protein
MNNLIVAIPYDFLKPLGKSVYLSYGDNCTLFLYSVQAKNDNLDNPIKLDVKEGGHFIIPNSFKAYANIKDKVIFLKIADRIEIWAKEKFINAFYPDKKAFDKYDSIIEVDCELSSPATANSQNNSTPIKTEELKDKAYDKFIESSIYTFLLFGVILVIIYHHPFLPIKILLFFILGMLLAGVLAIPYYFLRHLIVKLRIKRLVANYPIAFLITKKDENDIQVEMTKLTMLFWIPDLAYMFFVTYLIFFRIFQLK